MKKDHLNCPGQDYESPQVVCVDIDHEGVLCTSSEDFIIDDSWEDII